MNEKTEMTPLEGKTCPGCGAPVPADAPDGICPKCLAAGAVETLPGAGGMKGTGIPSLAPPSVADLDALLVDYEVQEEIGRGAMGAVYKARQVRLNRTVAIKVLPAEIAAAPAFVERFTREAHALASLAHPHIVTVHDVGSADGICFIVMEYVEGANLRKVLQAGKLAPKEALAIVVQVCEALQYAHDAGLVHRDIKPENILLTENGSVKIADFGLVKLVGAPGMQATLTATNQAMGTLRYMAPEQLEGAEADHRADIFSLGVVFYELLTGEIPAGRFAPPSKKVEVDVRLDEVVLRTLDQDPEMRYQNAAEVKTEVETISSDAAQAAPANAVSSPPVAAAEATPSPSAGMPAPTNLDSARQLVAAAATALTAAGVVSLVAGLWLLMRAGTMGGGFFGLAIIGLILAGSVVIIREGLGMGSLRSFKGAVWAAIFALAIPLFLGVIVHPGFLVCLVAPVWVIALLYHRDVRTGFVEGERDWAAQQFNRGPRFSRTAIFGALWAIMFFVALVPFFTLSASYAEASASPASPPAGLNIVAVAMIVFVGIPGLSAPIGATVLGFVALSQIRHSRGRLLGLPLALADALLFPILVMNCLIWYFFYLVCVQGAKWLGSPDAADPEVTPWVLIAILTLVGCAIADWLVVRASWRAAKMPVSPEDNVTAVAPV